jgi:hypothetical protein
MSRVKGLRGRGKICGEGLEHLCGIWVYLKILRWEEEEGVGGIENKSFVGAALFVLVLVSKGAL